jgi:trk system potassium uptake protein TrkA
MKILIIGAGEVGYYLAQELTQEKHDVIVVESNAEQLQRVSRNLDVLAIQGDGTRQGVLREAGISSADMLIAVTDSDEANIISCMIAREYRVKTKIARVRDHELTSPDSVLKPEKIGVDLLINPELETSKEIVRLIRHPAATDVMEFFDGRVELLGMHVADDSPAVGKTLAELGRRFTELSYRIVAIARGEKTLIPRGSEKIQQDDLVYVVTQKEAAQEVFALVNQQRRTVDHLMILGASRIGRLVAAELQKDHRIDVKLVDANPDKARRVAEMLDDTLVVEADGRDIDAMAAEGLIDMDVFVACTNDDENNIVTSLVAQHLGVKRTITLLEKRFYLSIIRAIGLEIGVNKHLLTSNAILKYIRHGKVLSFSHVRGINAETIVYFVAPKAKITKKPLKDLNLPDDCLIGAVHRGEEVIIPTGETRIEPADEALVFYLPAVRDKLNSWFD